MKRTPARTLVVFLSLSASCVLAAGLSSLAFAQKLPPLPVNEKNFPKKLAPVVEAEHAFASLSISGGMKEAFMRFAAPDGLLFRRTPVNAIELWRNANPAPTGLLTWYPTYADVSRAGDLGWTTGPWEFRAKPTDENAEGHGHFVTLWRRQPDGGFKYELDIGISHAAPARAETALHYPDSLRKSGAAPATTDATEAARAEILRAERELANDAAGRGSTRALVARADSSFRLYRQNTPPAVGLDAARRWLGTKTESLLWRTTAAGASRSGDLGYAYGTYELRRTASDEKPMESGHYVRIWQRRGARWRVVLDITNPVAPPAS